MDGSDSPLTPFQLFSLDMRASNREAFQGLSNLEIARRIVVLWTNMHQLERKSYYERVGRRIDRVINSKLKSLVSDDQPKVLSDGSRERSRSSTPNGENKLGRNGTKNGKQDTSDVEIIVTRSREIRYRRNARLPGPDRDTSNEALDEYVPRRRRARRRWCVFGW
jgi:hypothetical protein